MNIVVLAGGLSTERDVSIITGTKVCEALRGRGHKAVLLDVYLGYEGELDLDTIFEEKKSLLREEAGIQAAEPDLEKIRALRSGDTSCFFGKNVIAICKRADIVYMGLHGAEGENGKLQAAFDVLGVRYTGSGYLGSALAMDKGMAKKIFQNAGIPTPKGFSITKDAECTLQEGIAFPVVVKPCCGGSSVGVSMPENEEEYQRALELGFSYEDELLVEECIRGREFSVGVIDGKALPVIEIIPKEGFYDYQTKYQSGMAADVCPAELSGELTEKMQGYAAAVFRELKLEAYARIDFLMDEENRLYCLEANTLPGMTPTSLLPQEAGVLGIGYGELCEQIIGKSLEKYEGKRKQNNTGLLYGAGDMVPVWSSAMQGMTLKKIAEACGGTYYGPEEKKEMEVSMIVTDSRKLEKGCLFVAIKGARADGNDFVADAYNHGALCCLSEKEPMDGSKPYIVVESCYQALKDMAKLYRGMMKDIKIIGVTGSVGKTTTKEIIASVLSKHFCTLKTQGNFNNEVGVPLTLFRLRKEHEVAVVEMGISDFGEMTRLSEMVCPDSCIITNIGQCHLENLQDRDGVLRAKTEIFTSMNPNGTVYLNGDDDKLVTVRESGEKKIAFFGVENTSGTYAKNIENLGLKGTRMTVVSGEREFEVMVPAPGRHMVFNVLAAAKTALDLGMDIEEIQKGVAGFKPVGGHSSIVATDRFTILNDCYNANPASMKAGIDVLSEVSGRRVAIIGDMFELGTDEEKMHEEIGTYTADKGIELLLCIGELAKHYRQGAEKSEKQVTQVVYYSDKEEAVTALPNLLREEDTILVKASHGMHFEKIVAVLEKM